MRRQMWVASVQDECWTVARVAKKRGTLKVLQVFRMPSETAVADRELPQSPAPESLALAAPEAAPIQQNFKAWCRSHRIPIKHLRIAVSCPGVISRVITLPRLKARDLEILLAQNTDQYFTINLADYLVDYRVLESFAEDGQERQKILLVALPKLHWQKVWTACAGAGVKPKMADLAADCLARLYGTLSLQAADKTASTSVSAGRNLGLPDLAIVHLGLDRTEFVLLEHGVFFLYADVDTGLRGMPAVTPGRGWPAHLEGSEEPEQFLAGLEGASKMPSGAVDYRAELEQALAPVLQTLAEFLNFFAARHFGKTIDRIYLTGECADSSLTTVFEAAVDIETKVGFPGGWRPSFGRKAAAEAKNWMKYGVLYGLAWRED